MPELTASVGVEGVERPVERRREDDAVDEGRPTVRLGRELFVPLHLARGLIDRDQVTLPVFGGANWTAASPPSSDE